LIKSKEDLRYYLESDAISSGHRRAETVREKVRDLLFPDPVKEFQISLRKLEYLSNCKVGIYGKIQKFFVLRKFRRLSYLLGFSIPINVFGPGLSIAHYGTIVVNQSARVGANCRIHTGVNIGTDAGFSDSAPAIGDNCYIGPGAKLFGGLQIADGTVIGANAVVNKSVTEPCTAVAGVPARSLGTVEPFDLIIPGSIIAKSALSLNLGGMAAKEVHQELKKRKLL
jgi:serine O-acetyltransferase